MGWGREVRSWVCTCGVVCARNADTCLVDLGGEFGLGAEVWCCCKWSEHRPGRAPQGTEHRQEEHPGLELQRGPEGRETPRGGHGRRGGRK